MTNVAQTIRNQIGNRACMMLGAKDFVGDAKSLTFKIGRNAKGVTHLRVTLDPSDTYTVEALRVRCAPHDPVPLVKSLDSCSEVYVDSLHRTIEQLTGMHTSL